MPTSVIVPTLNLRNLNITVDSKDLDTIKAAILGRLANAAAPNHEINEVGIEIIPPGLTVRVTVTATPDDLTPTQIGNWL
jgi:hypothetical protein